jgi:hypothetical protein
MSKGQSRIEGYQCSQDTPIDRVEEAITGEFQCVVSSRKKITVLGSRIVIADRKAPDRVGVAHQQLRQASSCL